MTVSSRARRAERFVVSAEPFAAPLTIESTPLVAEPVAVDAPPFVEYVVVERIDPKKIVVLPSLVLVPNDAVFAVESNANETPSNAAPVPISTPVPNPVAAPIAIPTAVPAPTPVATRERRPAPSPKSSAVLPPTPDGATPSRPIPRQKPPRCAPPKTSKRAPSAAAPDAALLATTRSDAEPDFARLTAARPNVATTADLERLRVRPEPVAASKQLDFLREPTALEQAKKNASGWASSLVLHVALLACLAFLATNATPSVSTETIFQPGLSDEPALDEVVDPETAFDASENVEFETNAAIPTESNVVVDAPELSAFAEPTAAPLALPDDSLAVEPVAAASEGDVLGAIGGDDLSGRGAAKAAALATGGGSEGSEKSVALALAWLAEHQLADGSWSFQFAQCPQCGGACSRAGTKNSPFAATAMGLLPFLAAGNTPTEGKYKKVVAKGLRCLLENAKSTDDGLDMRDVDGNMYAHGLATIALCEAYAMQSDREKARNPRLAYAAQDAARFIKNAQDPSGGGWRYAPRQPGDTSVVGWQIMALKSARIGGLEVSDSTVRLATQFLRETVAFDDESRYGYLSSADGSAATTSAGLLCRLYLDLRTDAPAALAGADWIVGQGPNLNNPYYNYYATQFLHHVGGERWTRWNSAIRNRLIETQTLDGHERGSWYPADGDGHCQAGGRLYATSLNCMILEVYYRHMPLYRKLEESARFPLDLPAQD